MLRSPLPLLAAAALTFAPLPPFTAANAQQAATVPAPATVATTQRQGEVSYEIGIQSAAHHEARVTVTFPDVPRGKPLEVHMSRSSPGRYAIHEFAKNVYDVKAVDGQGRELDVTRPNPYQWDVHGHDGTVKVTYTVFGDRADGTYLAVDRSHLHFNAPAIYMWARGLEARPVRVTFDTGEPTWRIATQLEPTADSTTFTAPHLQYLLDSPVEVSDHEVYSWKVTSGGRTQEIRVALHHAGTDAEAAEYVDGTRRIVDAAIGVWGALPEFDYGNYTFLADYLPWVSGDGMEHRNSTIVISSRPLSTGMLGNLGTVSHEFFHIWNVERLRPADLEPFDFTGADMSDDLWFAEGFTQYYGGLIMRRAGLVSDTSYARTAGGIANAIINSPGRRFFSPVEMSRQAPFVDAATAIDPNNRVNTYISHYTGGAGIALALDMELRQRFNSSLDMYLRAMWDRFGRHQENVTPVRPYTTDDARRTLGEVTRDTAWANAFFGRYVTGHEAPDYVTLLAGVGVLLRPADPDRAWLGDIRWQGGEGGVALATPTVIGTPIYAAGLDAGDRITQLDGRPVASPEDIAAVLGAHRAGDAIPVIFESRGTRQQATITLATSPRLEAVLFEEAGRDVPAAARALRKSWMEGGR